MFAMFSAFYVANSGLTNAELICDGLLPPSIAPNSTDRFSAKFTVRSLFECPVSRVVGIGTEP